MGKARRINGIMYEEGKEYCVRVYFTGEKYIIPSSTDETTTSRIQLRQYFEKNDVIVSLKDTMPEDRNAPVISYIIDRNELREGHWKKESTFVFSMVMKKICNTTDEFYDSVEKWGK